MQIKSIDRPGGQAADLSPADYGVPLERDPIVAANSKATRGTLDQEVDSLPDTSRAALE